jgi:hypothetical protein
VRFGSRRVRVRRSDLDEFIAASTRQAAKKLGRYRVGLSDRDTSVPVGDGETTPEVWVYEVEASSANHAINKSIKRWRDEVGGDRVAQSITVLPA